MSFALGTDGWRGVIADGCTFEAIEKVAIATASVYRTLPAGDTSRVVIGHDTRFFSPEFSARAAEAIARCGVDVVLTDRPIPTPAVSWNVTRLRLAGGISITASHNPAEWNGFKIKSDRGGSASPELYAAVAAAMVRPAGAPASRSGRIETADLLGPYRDALAAAVNLDAIRRSGLSLLADSMHGAAGTIISEILAGGTIRALPFRSSRDPLFGGVHPEPIAANLKASAERVVRDGLDLAVAQDGDADRLGVLDRRGTFVSPHRVLALLLLHVYRRRGLRGGIARTFSTSLLIDRVAAALGVPLHETGIGFKYVADLMNRGEAAAGGEESGGYGFAFHLPERDGVLNALLLVESLALSGRDLDHALADLAAEFGEFAYGRRDVYMPVPGIAAFLEEVRQAPPQEIAGEEVTGVRDLDGVKYLFGDRGWLLHRLSGTEPMIRLYCEHEDERLMHRILDEASARLADFASRKT